MMKKLYTFLIALLLSGIVSGQWVQQSVEYGSNAPFRQIVFNNPNSGWVISGGVGPKLYTTNNGGLDWPACVEFFIQFI